MGQSVESNDERQETVLLLGPTGSGKTPLGQVLELRGLWGRGCLHFDFGEALRTAAREAANVLTDEEHAVVEKSLRTGALLEDNDFPIARKLFTNFLARRNAAKKILVVLNGLPRHEGQARAMQAFVKMCAVVSLECPPPIAWDRIRTNAGGDRSGRTDDTLERIEQRFQIYTGSTRPLLDYYRKLGVPVLLLDVGAATTAEQMRLQLELKQPY